MAQPLAHLTLQGVPALQHRVEAAVEQDREAAAGRVPLVTVLPVVLARPLLLAQEVLVAQQHLGSLRAVTAVMVVRLAAALV